MRILIMHETLILKYKESLTKLQNELKNKTKNPASITTSEAIWKYKHCLEEGSILLGLFSKTMILFSVDLKCGFVSFPKSIHQSLNLKCDVLGDGPLGVSRSLE